MDEITFNKTSNIFLNSGIVALYWYLDNRRTELDLEYTYELQPGYLKVKSDQLFKLLEDVYYLMGREVYDTVTSKQREAVKNMTDCNLYFAREKKEFVPFPKIKNYGLPLLFTNGRPKNTKKDSNQSTIAKLSKDDPELAKAFEKEFKEKNLDLKSVIYFDEPYTTIPRLDKIQQSYFTDAKPNALACSLTSEKYDKLVSITNNSAFIQQQGIQSFKSFYSSQTTLISWKAMYLSRFSPKLFLYSYVSGLEGMVGYFFNSDHLVNLYELYKRNRAFYKDEAQLIEDNYMSNIQLKGFRPRKSDEDNKSAIRDFTEQSEVLFLLIYEFYQQFLFEQNLTVDNDLSLELFAQEIVKIPVSLIAFRADKFASTLRPNAYEEFNNFKFAVATIHHLLKSGINIGQLMGSLKLIKPSEKTAQNSYRLERQTRGKVLGLILHKKPIAPNIAHLMYQCYTLKIADKPVGYKQFNILKKLPEIYEPIIQFGGNMHMNKEIQEKAINLGTSIGQGILRFTEEVGGKADPTKNARNGRRYIIGLYKARTMSQFNDAIIRIMNKYKIVVSKDILNGLEQANFEYIKQFAIISALNQINSALNRNSNENE